MCVLQCTKRPGKEDVWDIGAEASKLSGMKCVLPCSLRASRAIQLAMQRPGDLVLCVRNRSFDSLERRQGGLAGAWRERCW